MNQPQDNLLRHARTQGSAMDPVRSHPHRPTPNPATGALEVDPEIVLKAPEFGLQVEFFYSFRSDGNGPFGRRRSASVAWDDARVVRGDRKVAAFQKSVTIIWDVWKALTVKLSA